MCGNNYIVYIFAFSLTLTSLCNSNDISSMEPKLRKDLLAKYDVTLRPQIATPGALNLTYEAALYQLLSFDVKSEVISTVLWQRHFWVDERLRWSPEEYGGIEMLKLSPVQTWMPNLLPYSNIGPSYAPENAKFIPVTISHEGQVAWLNPQRMDTRCSMDLTFFPFDIQKCVISIGTWKYLTDELDLHCATEFLDTSSYLPHSQWKLLGTGCSTTRDTYRTGTYSSVHLTLKYQRMHQFYIRNLFIPNAVLLILSSLTFLLPSDRVSFGITVTLALCVNLIIVIGFVPETSKTIPKICDYYLASIFLSVLSIILSAFSLAAQNWKGKCQSQQTSQKQKRGNRLTFIYGALKSSLHIICRNVRASQKTEAGTESKPNFNLENGYNYFPNGKSHDAVPGLEVAEKKDSKSDGYNLQKAAEGFDMLMGVCYLFGTALYSLIVVNNLESGSKLS